MATETLSLEQRITRLEDVEAIKALKYQYAAYLDDGYNPEGISSLFTDNGLWVIKGVGGEAKGHEAIKQHCRNLSRDISWGQHFIMAPKIDLAPDGQTAKGTFYLIVFMTMVTPNDPNKKDAYVLAGKYDNKFAKIDGRWFFEELTGVIEQSAPWTEGWIKATLTKEQW